MSVSTPDLDLSQRTIASNLFSLITIDSLLRLSVRVARSKRSHHLISLSLLLSFILQADIITECSSPFWNLVEFADVHQLLRTLHIDLKAAAHLGSLYSTLVAA